VSRIGTLFTASSVIGRQAANRVASKRLEPPAAAR